MPVRLILLRTTTCFLVQGQWGKCLGVGPHLVFGQVHRTNVNVQICLTIVNLNCLLTLYHGLVFTSRALCERARAPCQVGFNVLRVSCHATHFISTNDSQNVSLRSWTCQVVFRNGIVLTNYAVWHIQFIHGDIVITNPRVGQFGCLVNKVYCRSTQYESISCHSSTCEYNFKCRRIFIICPSRTSLAIDIADVFTRGQPATNPAVCRHFGNQILGILDAGREGRNEGSVLLREEGFCDSVARLAHTAHFTVEQQAFHLRISTTAAHKRHGEEWAGLLASGAALTQEARLVAQDTVGVDVLVVVAETFARIHD